MHSVTAQWRASRDVNEHSDRAGLQSLPAMMTPERFDYVVALADDVTLATCRMVIERKSLPDLYVMSMHDHKRRLEQAASAEKATKAGIKHRIFILDCDVAALFRWNSQAAEPAVRAAHAWRRVKIRHQRALILHAMREIIRGYDTAGWKVVLQPSSPGNHECDDLIYAMLMSVCEGERYVAAIPPREATRQGTA